MTPAWNRGVSPRAPTLRRSPGPWSHDLDPDPLDWLGGVDPQGVKRVTPRPNPKEASGASCCLYFA